MLDLMWIWTVGTPFFMLSLHHCDCRETLCSCIGIVNFCGEALLLYPDDDKYTVNIH